MLTGIWNAFCFSTNNPRWEIIELDNHYCYKAISSCHMCNEHADQSTKYQWREEISLEMQEFHVSVCAGSQESYLENEPDSPVSQPARYEEEDLALLLCSTRVDHETSVLMDKNMVKMVYTCKLLVTERKIFSQS